jgi:hypothetical protein
MDFMAPMISCRDKLTLMAFNKHRKLLFAILVIIGRYEGQKKYSDREVTEFSHNNKYNINILMVEAAGVEPVRINIQQLTDIQVFPLNFDKYHPVIDRPIIAIFIIAATMTKKKYPKSTTVICGIRRRDIIPADDHKILASSGLQRVS